MDKFKLIIKVLICFFFFIITSSVIIQWIVTIPNPLGLGFITPETKDTWINFFGAIIGGGATLLGVQWTIKDNENQRKEDMYASHKPFLEVVPKTAKYAPNDFQFNSKWQIKIYIKSDNDSSHFTAIDNDFLTTIKFKNVGLGIAKHIIFTDFNYSFTEIKNVSSTCLCKNLPYELNVTYLYKIPYLLNDSVEEIPIIFFIDSNYENLTSSIKKTFKDCTLQGSVKIYYSDSYNNWFSQKMNFDFFLKFYSTTGISIYTNHIYLEDAKVEKNMQDLIDKVYQNKLKEQLEDCK